MHRVPIGLLFLLGSLPAQGPGIHATSHLAVNLSSGPTTAFYVRGAEATALTPLSSLALLPPTGDRAPTAFDFQNLAEKLSMRGIRVLAMSIGLDTVRVELISTGTGTEAVAAVEEVGWIAMAFVLEAPGSSDDSDSGTGVLSYVLTGSSDPEAGTVTTLGNSAELLPGGEFLPSAVDQHLPLYIFGTEFLDGGLEPSLPRYPTFFFTFDPEYPPSGSIGGSAWSAQAVYRTQWMGTHWGPFELQFDWGGIDTTDEALAGLAFTALDGLAVDTQVAGSTSPHILLSPRQPASSRNQDHEVIYVGPGLDGGVQALPYVEAAPLPKRKRVGAALDPKRGIGDFSENDPGLVSAQVGTGPNPPTELDACVFASRLGDRRRDLRASGARTGRLGTPSAFWTQCAFPTRGAPLARRARLTWWHEKYDAPSKTWVVIGKVHRRMVEIYDGRAREKIALPASLPGAARSYRAVAHWEVGTPGEGAIGAAALRRSYQLLVYY